MDWQTRFVRELYVPGESTQGNLGVLLNGIRGTGKTVTCEMICNMMDLPVIVVDTAYDNIGNFLAEIQQDLIIFFDEFEKVFPREYGSPSKLLMIMDGVMKGEYRKLFMLTTNEISIEPNMIQRPGRIRYLKTFGNLAPDIIYEIVKDLLEDQTKAQAVVEFIAELEMITVDIVTAIIKEVNIHNEVPTEFKDIFNVKTITEVYTVHEVIRDEMGVIIKENLVADAAKLYPQKIDKDDEGMDFYVNKKDMGLIEEVLDFDLIAVRPNRPDDAKDEDPDPELKFYKITPKSSYNKVFKHGPIDMAYW